MSTALLRAFLGLCFSGLLCAATASEDPGLWYEEDAGDSPPVPPEVTLDNPIATQYVFVGSGPYRRTFAVIADPHAGIAGGDEQVDYGYGSGWNDRCVWPPNGFGADRLQELVDHINANWTKGITREWWADGQRVEGRVEFAIVVGDLTESGELSEFVRARRILDRLNAPYVPLPGNHDVVPHVYRETAQYPGDMNVTWSWSDVISSVCVENVRAEGIVVYQDPNYNGDLSFGRGTEGRSQVFFWDAADLRLEHIGNDAIQSIKCVRTSSNAERCQYRLFLGAGFQGCRTEWLSRDIANLREEPLSCVTCEEEHAFFYRKLLDWEGVSSIQVLHGDPGNAPSICSDENYSGRWEVLLLDDRNLSGNRVGNDSVDSIWIPYASSRARAILYEAADFDTSRWRHYTATDCEYRIGHASPGAYQGYGDVFGDRHFDAEFSPVYTALSAIFPNWKKHPGACFLSDTERYIDRNPGHVWLENFAFDVGDYNFLCLDFSLRKRFSYQWPLSKIAGGTGTCRTYGGISGGTLPWAIEHIAGYPNKREENILVFAHYPPIGVRYRGLVNVPIPFSDLRTLKDAFLPYRNYVSHWFGGHLHRSYREEIYHEYQGAKFHLFSSVETNSSMRPDPNRSIGGGIECLTIVTVASERPFAPFQPIEGPEAGSLSACYDFDERKFDPELQRWVLGVRDTQVYDLSGYSFGGILRSAGSAEYFPGVSGSAIWYNGDDWVEVDCSSRGFASPLKPQTLTIEAWVLPASSGPEDRYALALGSDWGIYLGANSSLLWYKFRSVGRQVREAPIAEVPLGRWSHVAVTYDGRCIRSYLDGVLRRSDPASGPISYSADRLYLGAGSGAACWHGSLDNVRIWRVALSPSQVSEHASLVAYWSFDEQEPGRTGYTDWTVFDRSANSNAARARSESGASFEWGSGARGSAIVYNGDDFVQVPSAWAFDFDGPFTVEAWVNLDSAQPDQKIVSRTSPDGRRGFNLGVISGALYPEVWAGGLRYSFVAGSVPARRWTRLRMTWDGSTLRGFVDSSLVGQVGVPCGGAGPRTPGGVLTVGCASWSRALKVRGRIDEVRLWRRALGEGEAAELECEAPPEGEPASALPGLSAR